VFERVEDLVAEHAELERRLADPAVHADQGRARRLGRRYAELGAIVRAYDAWRRTGEDEQAARELAADDPGFAAEAEQLAVRRAELEERLRTLLLPRDPNDDRDVILEIKAGEGGEESALFAADLLRMYLRFAERANWRPRRLQGRLGRGQGEGHARGGCGAVRSAEVRGRRSPRAARACD